MAATKNAASLKNDTKEFITTALIQLLRKDALQNITISKVAARAGVSRMAFYRNFNNLKQILYEYYDKKFSKVFDDIKNSKEEAAKLNSHLIFFDKFSEDLVLSHKHGYEPIVEEVFIKKLSKLYGVAYDSCKATFMAAGTYALWRKWLLDGMKTPLDEVIRTISTFNAALRVSTIE